MSRQSRSDILDLSDFPISFVRRAVFQGTGVDMDELGAKPMIAVVNSLTEINAGHMHLGALALRVKEGIHAAGGIPFELNVPAPCDGIAMGHAGMRHVLAQRDLIADIVETHVRSMRYDGMVLIASCDKIIPGMLMAAARLDLPTIFLTGGFNAFQIRFEPAMRASISHHDYDDPASKLATTSCASCGSCEIMGTANTFQCLTEALGIALPGSAAVPAYHSRKLTAARQAGKRIVQLVHDGLTARQLLTRDALLNALVIDLAIGGSTNATLHLPALARQLDLDFPLALFNEYNRKVPTLCRIAPNGPHGMLDFYSAGGVPAVMRAVQRELRRDALTVAGGTLGDVIARAPIAQPDVIALPEQPFLPEGGTVVLFGNLAPDGAIVKQSAVRKDMLTFSGPARVFESEAECLAMIRRGGLRDGEVLVLRNEGPKGGPGMPEMLAVTTALDLTPYQRIALITDGRFSGATAGPCIGHVSPEAFERGPIAALRDGDLVTIDIPNRRLSVDLTAGEIDRRIADRPPVVRDVPAGYMRRYRRLVSSAAVGAVIE